MPNTTRTRCNLRELCEECWKRGAVGPLIFDTTAGNAEDEVKLRAVRTMMRLKFLLAVEETDKLWYMEPGTLEDEEWVLKTAAVISCRCFYCTY